MWRVKPRALPWAIVSLRFQRDKTPGMEPITNVEESLCKTHFEATSLRR